MIPQRLEAMHPSSCHGNYYSRMNILTKPQLFPLIKVLVCLSYALGMFCAFGPIKRVLLMIFYHVKGHNGLIAQIINSQTLCSRVSHIHESMCIG